jgi:hypothetical protein
MKNLEKNFIEFLRNEPVSELYFQPDKNKGIITHRDSRPWEFFSIKTQWIFGDTLEEIMQQCVEE